MTLIAEHQVDLWVALEKLLNCRIKLHEVSEIDDTFLKDYIERSISIDSLKESIEGFFRERKLLTATIGESGYRLPGESGYRLPGESGYRLPGESGYRSFTG
jgi:hypothetical protein